MSSFLHTCGRLLSLGAVVVLCACEGEIVSGVLPDAESVTQFELWWRRAGAASHACILVVDDAPTDAARLMRQRLAEDLVDFFNDLDASDCGMDADPAVYRPIDFRLVVVGASGTLPPRFRDEEGLHAFGKDASPDLLRSFEAAGAAAIVEMETEEVLPSVGAAELAHIVNLLQGVGEARSPLETELVGVLGQAEWPWAALATTRPDTSPEPLHLAAPARPFDVLLLDWPESGSCPDPDEDTVFPALEPLRSVWTSPDCFESARVFDPRGVADCIPACLPRAPAADAEGRVECRLFGEFPVDVDCEQQAGWTFIERTESAYDSDEHWPVNLCELGQAEGAALQACMVDFACEGCEPSFCYRRPFTEADGEDPAHQRPTQAEDSTYCEIYEHGAPLLDRLRVVQGADQIDGLLHVICQQ